MNEPAELKDVADKADDSSKIKLPDEGGAGIATETKIGLALVVLLLAAFGFMVWQKWSRSQAELAAKNGGETPPAESPETEPKSAAKDEKDDAGLPPDPFGDPAPTQGEPPVRRTAAETAPGLPVGGGPEVIPVSSQRPTKLPQEFPDGFETSPKPASPGAEMAGDPAKETEDPFGDPAPTATTPADDPAPTLTVEADDPFGDPAPAAEPAPTANVPTLDVTEPAADADPFGAQPELPSLGGPGLETPAATAEPAPTLEMPADEFSPFGDSPEPADATEATPTLEDPAPADEFPSGPSDSADPFGAPAETPAAMPAETPVADPAESFEDPLPLLDRVPDNKPTGTPPKFEDFEPVESGHASSGSVTQVRPSGASAFPPLSDGPAPSLERTPPAGGGSPAGDPFAAPPARPGVQTYKVQNQDTYWTISRKFYGTSRYYVALARFNQPRISDPRTMRPGMYVVIPTSQVLETKNPDLFPRTPKPDSSVVAAGAAGKPGLVTDEYGEIVYRVGKNDTLTGIAEKHLGRSSRWIQIFELNRDKLRNPDELKIGTLLKLPRDASRVQFVRGDNGTRVH